MANVGGRRQAIDTIFEEIVPSSAWTEDSSCHYLLVDLPGFKKEWLTLQIDDHGHIVVGGKKQSENKIEHFEQIFKVAENADIDKISGSYEGEILYIVVPKQVKEEEREGERTVNSVEEKHKREHDHEKHEHEHGQEKHEQKHKHDEEKHEHEKHKQENHEHKEHEKHDKEKDEQKHKHDEEKHEHEKHKQEEHEHEKHKQEEHEQEKQDKEKHEHRHKHDQEKHKGWGHIGHRYQEEEENGRTTDEGEYQDATGETWRREVGLLGSIMEILSKNKGIVVTAAIAFSLGVLLSQKFQSNTGTEGVLSPV